jgi:hypothetical protein
VWLRRAALFLPITSAPEKLKQVLSELKCMAEVFQMVVNQAGFESIIAQPDLFVVL